MGACCLCFLPPFFRSAVALAATEGRERESLSLPRRRRRREPLSVQPYVEKRVGKLGRSLGPSSSSLSGWGRAAKGRGGGEGGGGSRSLLPSNTHSPPRLVSRYVDVGSRKEARERGRKNGAPEILPPLALKGRRRRGGRQKRLPRPPPPKPKDLLPPFSWEDEEVQRTDGRERKGKGEEGGRERRG